MNGSENSAVIGDGAELRKARIARGLSLREVAARTGVSAAALSQLETGKASLALERLAVVARFLEIDFDPPASRATTHGRNFRHWREFEPVGDPPVLKAALDLFLEKGYHGSAIREIADRAGMSVAGIYHYYPSKQAMLFAIMDAGLRELIARSEAARDDGRDAVERICLLVEAIVLYHIHRREEAFIGVSELRSLSPENLALHVALRDQEQHLVDDEVVAAVEAGKFDLPDPRSAARALVTMCTAVVHWYRPDRHLTATEIAHQYARYSLGVLGPPIDAFEWK